MSRYILFYVFFLLFSLTTVLSAAFFTPHDTPKIEQAFGKLPIYFIENQGQIQSDDVAYFVKGVQKTLYFTKEGITFSLQGENKRWTVKLDFVGKNPDVVPQGVDKQQAIFSYFKGKPEDWKAGLPTYSRLIYEDLWSGIDLVYHGYVNQLKYDFIVQPGGDPDTICLEYSGAASVTVAETGVLKISTPVGGFSDDVPYAYQMIKGEKKEISIRYAHIEGDAEGAVSYGFDLGNYDRNESLILDPSMLVYCGYIGGSCNDLGFDIALDAQGNAYVTGETYSDENSFPVTVGPDLSYNDIGWYGDAFIAKVNSKGTDLVYCGYIGGNDSDTGVGIAVDLQGNAYVTGNTASDESSFPVLAGPDLTFNGGVDSFVAKLNAQGTGFEYCGYIGGNDRDWANGIGIDDQGNAYITGVTESNETSAL